MLSDGCQLDSVSSSMSGSEGPAQPHGSTSGSSHAQPTEQRTAASLVGSPTPSQPAAAAATAATLVPPPPVVVSRTVSFHRPAHLLCLQHDWQKLAAQCNSLGMEVQLVAQVRGHMLKQSATPLPGAPHDVCAVRSAEHIHSGL